MPPGAILCPSCRKLISADEPRCPYCGTLRPGLWGFTPALQQVFGARVDLVPIVVGACVVLYAIGLLLDLGAVSRSGFDSLLAPSMEALYRLGMTGGFATRTGRWWTLLTAVYLHGGLLHLAFNMISFVRIGQQAQEVFGRARFFLLFTLTGVAGFALSNAVSAHPSVGASGAIFGLIGALIGAERRQRTPWSEILMGIAPWATLIIIMSLTQRGINHFAHLGGLASGILLGQWLPAQHQRREGRSVQLAALACAALTLAGFIVSFSRPLFGSRLF
jgi:rhomboid protease GluP